MRVWQNPGEAGHFHDRLDYLDGVRGLAALFVVAHHLWRSYNTAALGGFAGFCTNWLLYGHLSVDVFIVLSGFCLMLPVARCRALRGGWQRFYAARARRILPPLYAAVLFSIGVALYHRYFFSRQEILANVLLIQDFWQGKNNIDQPLWSVAVECKIYLLFPAFVFVWLRFGPAVLLLTAAAAGEIAEHTVCRIPCVTDIALLCPWFVILFAMGMVAAEFALRVEKDSSEWRMRGLFAAALGGLGLALWTWPVTAGGEYVLYAPHFKWIDILAGAVSALSLLMLGRQAVRKERTFAIAVLSWKPLVFVGTMAYSLYLIHLLLIFPLKEMVISWLPFHPAFVVIPVVMAITVGISYIFHLLIERPFMSRRAPRTEREAAIAAAVYPAP